MNLILKTPSEFVTSKISFRTKVSLKQRSPRSTLIREYYPLTPIMNFIVL